MWISRIPISLFNLSDKVAGEPHTGGIPVCLLIKTNGRNLSFIIFRRETGRQWLLNRQRKQKHFRLFSLCMANLQCAYSWFLLFPMQLLPIHLTKWKMKNNAVCTFNWNIKASHWNIIQWYKIFSKSLTSFVSYTTQSAVLVVILHDILL